MTGRSSDNIRQEARAWVLRHKDASTAEDRAAFERWLSQDTAHRATYDEVDAAYESAGLLRSSEFGRERNLGAAFPQPRLGPAWGFAIAAIVGLLVVGGYELSGGQRGLHPITLESVMLSSGAEERSVTLADGTHVNMAPASQVRIELGPRKRLAEVDQGRVRLTVKQEQRPFRIVAGTQRAEAEAGTFEAAIVEGRGTITAVPPPGPAFGALENSNSGPPLPLPPAVRQMVEFDAEPLGQAVERVNRIGSGRRIEIDPSLAGLRVTGVFQQGSSETIARALARAFALDLDTTASGTLLLAPKK